MAESSPSNSAGPGRWIIPSVLGVIFLAPFIAYPPVRVVSLRTAQAAAQAGVFDPREFAAKFWQEKLLPGLGAAVDARTLDEALAASPSQAAKQHARLVGIGGTAYYLITGEGTVTAADDDEITLALTGGAPSGIVLDTGLLFGNALRDGTGLLDVNRFTHSEAFNAVAAELNALVESTVLPVVRQRGTVGTRLRFTGIAEISSTNVDPRPLHLIPIRVETSP